MDIRSSSEGTSLVVSAENNIGTYNKRKRKAPTDDKNIENLHPTKKSYIATTTGAAASNVCDYSDNGSNSPDYYSSSTLQSPPSVTNILSPIDGSPNNWSNGVSIGVVISSVGATTASSSGGGVGSARGDLTPHGQKKINSTTAIASPIKKNSCSSKITCNPNGSRLCPLPPLKWANSFDVWRYMCRKDEKASLQRESGMLNNHPGVLPRMRAILLDWLIEVCEVYKLHRETYYLAVDYLDRYLSIQNNKISKTRLQLIGITCLFIAAKVEEIYPPKIGEFAYVTDGACRESDIIGQEQALLSALKWCITPVTIIGWLSVYMQLTISNRSSAISNKLGDYNSECVGSSFVDKNGAVSDEKLGDAFVYPQFSGLEFVQAAQLIDLCTLDLGLADYPYSIIAAAALSHTLNKSSAIKVSGLDWESIAPCFKWMKPFYDIICEESPPLFLLEQNEQVKPTLGLHHICPNIVTDDSHIIQTHSTTLNMFDKAVLRREKLMESAVLIEASPAQTVVDQLCPDGLLTPPASNRKFLDSENGDSDIVVVAATTAATKIYK